MKHPSQDYAREDEGGGSGGKSNRKEYPLVTLRHNKRVKVEALSPPSVHGDEENDDDDPDYCYDQDDTQIDARVCPPMSSWTRDQLAPPKAEPEFTELQVSRALRERPGVSRDSKLAAAGGCDGHNDSCDGSGDEDSEIFGFADGQHPGAHSSKNQVRIPATQNVPARARSPSSKVAASAIITATTPPQTPPPAAPSEIETDTETETAIAHTNLENQFQDTAHTHRHLLDRDNHDNISITNEALDQQHQHQHRHNEQPRHRAGHRPSFIGPPISRDRADETRLSEEQREHLNSIIKFIREGHLAKLREALEDGQRKFTRNILNAFVRGNTALHHALLQGRGLAWCKLLVANGADPTLTNLAGWHPIHLAAHNGTCDTMSYLISQAEPSR